MVGTPRHDEAASTGLVRDDLLVPVAPDGCLDGVLEIVSPNGAFTDDSLERSIALGHLLELALSNWAAHEQLEQAGRAEERRRIARDLHDGLAHELAYIASMARSSWRARVDVDVQELSSAADRALDEARRAITVLSAAAPQSLVGAVAQTAEDLGARLGVAVRLEVADDIDTPPDVTEHVLRIVREAITNAATHGGPTVVTVTVRRDDGVRVVIEDDGCGFDPELGARSGFGLVSMRERADAIGAGFAVASAPSLGHADRARAPVSDAISVLVADDHARTRALVRLALEHSGEFRVCAEAHDTPTAIAAALVSTPTSACSTSTCPEVASPRRPGSRPRCPRRRW